jgi:hypothetical protein
MSKVTFDGPNKLINLNLGVDTLDVQIDLYSEWKRWSVLDINLKFEQAFRTFGGDQTISGQFAPRYFFLTNGWRIVVDTAEDVNIGVNLFTDELDTPFITSNNSTVTLRNSDSPVVDTGIAQSLDYGGMVVVNSSIGVGGDEYPTGTLGQPASSISYAKVIAEKYGITKIKAYGSTLIDVDLIGYQVIGGNLTDVITINNANVDKTTFRQCLLYGAYQGEIAADNCIIGDEFTGMNGYFQHCGFLGNMNFDEGVECVLNDCHSQVPGMNSPAIYLDKNIKLSLRKYSGGLAIYDSQSGTTATLEFLVGNCRVLSGNTGGELVIRGLASLTDESSGTTVNTTGLLIPYNVATQHSLNVNTEILKNK